MSAPLVITDPMDAGPPAKNPIERWFAARLKDPRDIKFVRVSLAMTLTVIPAGLSFFFWDFPGWLLIPYVALVFGLSAGRYVLMLHATCHRMLFKGPHKLLNNWIPWLIAPFYGQTPGSFYAHHMGMHHPENNLEPDLSCTLGYQRDKFSHFMHYWARFFFVGLPNLVGYLNTHKRAKLGKKLLIGEGAWWIGVIIGMFISPWAAFGVFVVPMLLMRWFMMCGNWAQHSFVDVDDPNNCYTNSTCLINVPYNHKAYNDGYHIVHHLFAAMHWTQHPVWFMENLEEFGKNDAVVFNGLGNNQTVWWCLMKDDYGKLADHLLDLPGGPVRTREEKIAFLQHRVRRRRGEVPPWIAVQAAAA